MSRARSHGFVSWTRPSLGGREGGGGEGVMGERREGKEVGGVMSRNGGVGGTVKGERGRRNNEGKRGERREEERVMRERREEGVRKGG